jgi:hypothetical protein
MAYTRYTRFRISYGLPTIEAPDRAMLQLVNLSRGHALLTGRDYVAINT